jgi:uncharacterized protein (TIGR03437 family)
VKLLTLAALWSATCVMAQTAIEPRITSETLPAGGTIQLKLGLTSPNPIIVGHFEMSDFSFDRFDGVALFSPQGDAYGVVIRQGTRFVGNFSSPLGGLGTQLDYPFFVVAASIPTGLPAGRQIPLNIAGPTQFTAPNGVVYPMPAPKSGVLTIGGSVSISNVIPGGGLLPAGYVVRVLGTGFNADTRITVNEVNTRNEQYISPTEMQFTLASAADLTGKRITVRNKDNSDATYYSYLRALVVGQSSIQLLNDAYPIFSPARVTSALLNTGASPANGFVAVALLNSTLNPFDVVLELTSSSGSVLRRATISLPATSRWARSVEEIFNTTAPVGSYVRISSATGVGALGLRGDLTTANVTAFATGDAPAPAPATLSVAPTSLMFNYQLGGATPATQTLAATSSGSAITINASSGASWLTVTPTSGSTPLNLSVGINPAGLAAGTYNGNITVNSTTIPVTLNVTAAPTLQVAPTSLTFNYQQGASNPAAQTLAITSTGGSLGVNASTTTPWLGITPTSGTTPVNVSVSVNPTGLAPGNYSGSITINATNIPVTLTVTAAPVLNVAPTSLSFTYQQGGASPAAQSLALTATGGSLAISASTNTPWLSITPASGATPVNASVSVNPAGLAPGTYSAAITINATSIPVTLAVTAAPVLSIAPSSLSFTYQQGGALPAAQTLAATATGGNVSITATAGAAWITVSPTSGTTPTNLSVGINPAGLAVGNYSSSITVNGNNIPVALTITAAPTPPSLSANPANLSFAYMLGGAAPASQSLQITSSAAPITLSINTPTSWLSVTPTSGATPLALNVTADPTGLAAGSYTGSITVNTLTIPVVLVVSGAPTITASPASLQFNYQLGGALPASQSINATSVSGALNATVSTPTSWLSVSPASGTTPFTISVSINPTGLVAGSYTGIVNINTTAIPVTLNITQATTPSFSVTPTALSFATNLGVAPAAQTLAARSSTPGLAVNASTTTAWLSLATSATTTPADITVRVDPTGLTAGSYNGSVLVNAISVPVTLVVSNSATTQWTLSPQSMGLFLIQGAALPELPTARISSTPAGQSFRVSSSAPWLTPTVNQSTTPATLSLGLTVASLAVGNYTGVITVTPTVGDPLSLTVNLQLAAGVTPQPQITAIVNSADQLAGRGISPGEILTIYGAGLADAGGVSAGIAGGTSFQTQAGNARVFVNGIAIPVLYASPNQINAQAPYDLPAGGTALVEVDHLGVRSAPFALTISTALPAIFTVNSSGQGPGAILNQDYSLNTSARPASRGSAIMIYGTGAGQGTRSLIAGGIEGNLPTPTLAPVVVILGGIRVPALYAGTSPGSVNGLVQVNVIVPQNAPSGGAIPVQLEVNGQLSRAGVTVAIE